MVFGKVNKIDKPLASLGKKKIQKIQKYKIINERGNIIMDNTEMQRNIMNYYDLHANKLDSLEEMGKFLET